MQIKLHFCDLVAANADLCRKSPGISLALYNHDYKRFAPKILKAKPPDNNLAAMSVLSGLVVRTCARVKSFVQIVKHERQRLGVSSS